ncbi:MAG: hypothetical protein EOO14_00380 [Chitinophagaceae bacterium]|nr:MAG: hypothetical protein EOO14_00380 [Chitinophagaceae bacterium]
MQQFTIHLPVKAYVKKYLHQKYGSPLTLSAGNVFSDVFLAMLLVPAPIKNQRRELDLQLNRYTEKVQVKIPIDLLYRVPNDLTEHSTGRLNRFFENMFKEDFCEKVEHLVSFGKIERQTAMEHFCVLYGFEMEEDISFDALKKMEWRYRKEKAEKMQKSLAHLSPAVLFG